MGPITGLEREVRWLGREVVLNAAAGHEIGLCTKARGPPANPLSTHSDAINAAIGITADVMTDCSARNGPWPEGNASPGNATHRIVDVLAIHDRAGR